jgi:PAS domain S-box-containing protein
MNEHTIKILVVEDNPVDAIRLKHDLTEINCKKCEFADAESLREALEFLKTEVFHLILLDLGLPDTNGINTLIGIQNSAADTPIVVMSGLDDESVAVEAVARGAQDYLLKDKWDPRLVARSLHHAIQRHQLLAAYKQANESSLRANRALRVLSECNHFLVRATEERQFLDDICRILVDHGGYRMAWIGLKIRDEARSIQPVAVAGFEDGYLRAAKITWSDDATGRGPTGTAIRTGIIKTNRNSWTNPDYTPWRSEALKRDYASSIALPLTGYDEIMGALTIYSSEPDAFDDEEQKLLGQLADDLSYGIRTLRMRSEKEKADLALQESEQRFRAIFDGAKDYIVLKDRSLRYTLVNPAVEKLLGVPASEILGSKDEDFFGEDAAAQVRDVEMRVLEGKSVEEEHTRRLSGIPRTFLDSRIPWLDGQGNVTGILTISREITERKGMESSPLQCKVAYTSKAMRATLSLANVAAQNDSTILLLGESGSGKDYLAKYIHNCSARSSGPYFSVNCASIAASLAESELFGHEKGAFTGALGRKRGLLELAEGGTLLLNEIGELSVPLQAKLLTFLDTRKFTRVGGEKEVSVNVRLIAATNRDLADEVEKGGFRKDLFYRINVMAIKVPPLRERRQDIPILVQEMLSQLCEELHVSSFPIVDASTMERLKKYNWPGNVRELRNVLERSLILSEGKEVTLGNIELRRDLEDPRQMDGAWLFATPFPDGRSLNEITQDLKRSLVSEALIRSKGSRQGAARLLGISRYSLKHYMKSLGMMESFPDDE